MAPPHGACGRGCAPGPETNWGGGLSERSEFRSPNLRDRGKGTRRATPGRPWFWVLLPKQKDLGVRGRNPALAPISVAGFVKRNVEVAQLSQEPQHQFSEGVGHLANTVKQSAFVAGGGGKIRGRRRRRDLSHAGRGLAGGQPSRVLSQQLGEGEEMVQFNIFGEAVFPLIDRRSRDAERLGNIRLGQTRLCPGGSNSISQSVHKWLSTSYFQYPPLLYKYA